MATGPLATQADPLAQLRDIHLPGAIEAFPPAPGWWLLAALAIGSLTYILFRLFRQWQKGQYRREALNSLLALKTAYEQDATSIDYLQQYNDLLKRVALTRFPRQQVAGLTGEAWVAFLDRTGATREFAMGAGQVLINGNYSQDGTFDVHALHQIGSSWIKHHNPAKASQ